jgi:hypothetical protein
MTTGPFVHVNILITSTRTHCHEDDNLILQLREIFSEIKKLKKRQILLRFWSKRDAVWKANWENLTEDLKMLRKDFSRINKRRHARKNKRR